MDIFKLEINYTPLKNGLTLPKSVALPYYKASKSDKLCYDIAEFRPNQVLITGSRKQIDNSKSLLTTIRSTYYFDAIRALILLYFYIGGFAVNNISLSVNSKVNSSFYETEIDQLFLNNLSESLPIKNLEKIITESNLSISKIKIDVLIHLILASQEYVSYYHKFSYSWRAFEQSIHYSFPQKGSNITKNLISLCEDLKKSSTNIYANSIELADKVTEEELSNLRLKSFLLHDIQRTQKTIEGAYGSFDDYRIKQALKSAIEQYPQYFHVKFENEGYPNSSTNSIDIIRLFALKYGYFLRNTLFHANQISRSLVENDLTNELKIVYRYVRLLGIDVFNQYNPAWTIDKQTSQEE